MTKQVKPVHYDKETVRELTKQIAVASCLGAVQGALISVTSALVLRRVSTVYRTVRMQVRVFYHCAWISMGAVFKADSQLLKFQREYYANEGEKRDKILDAAADRGIFLEDDYIMDSVITGDRNR